MPVPPPASLQNVERIAGLPVAFGALTAVLAAITLTHALLCGSIAIDAGASAGAPPTDQRGFPRIVGSAPDVGSFEGSADTTPPTAAATCWPG